MPSYEYPQELLWCILSFLSVLVLALVYSQLIFLTRIHLFLFLFLASMQEPIILCLTRFAALLSPPQRSQPSQPPLNAQESSFERKSLLNILKKVKKKQKGLISKVCSSFDVLSSPSSVSFLLHPPPTHTPHITLIIKSSSTYSCSTNILTHHFFFSLSKKPLTAMYTTQDGP